MPFAYRMQKLAHEVRSGETEYGQPTWAAPVFILGKIQKKLRRVIRGESEERQVSTVLHVDRNYTVNEGDRVAGFEVVQEMDNNEFLLG